jgi:large subunit ribosomal protein L23
MALFGSKKKTEVTKTEKAVKQIKATKTAKAVAVRTSGTTAVFNHVILRPRITEKAGIANEALNVYTFEVSKNATKKTVAHAVKSLYKVTPLKIRTVSLPRKEVFNRGHFGHQPAVKKALVFLKKGDKIVME